MASSFAELYSDFIDGVKIYTEKLDVTELSFMRMYTRGMQRFQRETEYIESTATLTRATGDDAFFVPNDMWRLKRLKDVNGFTLLQQSFEQYQRLLESWPDGHLETPTDYSMKMRDVYRIDAPHRIFTIYQRTILLYPEPNDTGNTDLTLELWYIPDIEAISTRSSQWTAWRSADGSLTGAEFNNLFRTAGVTPSLSPFEEAFLNYTKAQYIMSQGNKNYKVFEDAFYSEVQRAKDVKPVQFRQGAKSYMIAPWS